MIDSFLVKADSDKNLLLVQLRGHFMKSELELAFYIARKEITKLKEGFDVLLDLDGMLTDKDYSHKIHQRARKIFITLGASRVRWINTASKIKINKRTDSEYFAFDNVGFYPN
jgi:hypothetical protein